MTLIDKWIWNLVIVVYSLSTFNLENSSSEATKILVMNCEDNEVHDDGSGAWRTGLNFQPLQPFTLCSRFQFKKLRIHNIFAYFNDPGKRPPLELQVNVKELRIVLAWEYKMVFLEENLRPFQWYHLCLSFDPVANNTILIYLDGKMVSQDKIDLNSKTIGANLTVGFRQEPQKFKGISFIGNITQFDIWQEILPKNIIKDLAECKRLLIGSFVSWGDDQWQYQNVTLNEINFIELCQPQNKMETFILPPMIFQEAVYACEGIGGSLAIPSSIKSAERLYNSILNKSSTDCPSSYFVGIWDKFQDGIWRRHANNKVIVSIPWSNDEPNGLHYENCGTLKKNGICDEDCQQKRCSICELPSSIIWLMHGTCEQNDHNMNYFLKVKNNEWIFQGYGDYTIYKNDTSSTWLLVNNYKNTVIASLKSKYPFGRNQWKLMAPLCGTKEDKRDISLATCKFNEYACNDGTCITRKKRCDFQPDCNDYSDELNCISFKVANDYKPSIPPRGTKKNPVLYVIAHINIESMQVDTKNMLLHIQFNLSLVWFEGRTTYYHLKEDLSLNIVNMQPKLLWTPSIIFRNTKNQSLTQVDSLNQIRVLREKRDHSLDLSVPEAVDLYSGDSNPIINNRRYRISFTCNLDLSRYPFDRQICFMDLRQRSSTAQALQFNATSEAIYSGNENLIEYRVGTISLNTYVKDGYSGLMIFIPLKRMEGYAIINIYIPSSIMLFISYLTMFFKLDNFQVRILGALTSLLVIETLYTEVGSSLPKTSYFKLVDVWLLFCICTIFFVLMFHSIIDVKILPKPGQQTTNRQSKEARKVEKIGRVLVAAGIFLFNACYWSYIY